MDDQTGDLMFTCGFLMFPDAYKILQTYCIDCIDCMILQRFWLTSLDFRTGTGVVCPPAWSRRGDRCRGSR